MALAAAAWIFWEARVIAPGTVREGFFQLDFYTLMYPMYQYGFGQLSAGHVPLWNPYSYTGIPFLATLYTGILYPGNFLFLLLPTGAAMGMTVVLHTFMAGWFMYLLGRAWRWSRLAALVAALTWAFSQNAVWFFGPICFIASAAWIPLMALGIGWIAEGRHRRGAALLGASVAMALLAGGTQVVVYGAYALAPYAAVRLWMTLRSRGSGAFGHAFVWMILAALTSLALAAPQILPTAELTAHTQRAPGSIRLEWADNVMEPVRKPSGVAASGPTAAPGRVGQALRGFANVWGHHARDLPAFHFGVLPPLLAVAALMGARRRLAIGLVGGAALATLLSWGLRTRLYDLYHALPTGDWFRNPNRFALLTGLAIAILAGLGVTTLERGGSERRRGLAGAGLAGIGGLALLLLAGAPARETVTTLIAAASGIALLGITTAARRPPVRWAAALGVIAVLFAQLAFAYRNPYVHPEKDASRVSAHTAASAYLQRHTGSQRVVVVNPVWSNWDVQRKYGLLHKLRTLNDFEPLTPVRFRSAFSLLQNTPPDETVPFDGWLRLDPAGSNKTVLDMLAIRYVLVDRSLASPWDERAADFGFWRVAISAPRVSLFENPTARPRASLVPRAIVTRSETEAAAVIRSPAFDPRSIVVIEAPGGYSEPEMRTGPQAISLGRWKGDLPEGDGEGEVRFIRDGTERVVLEATVPEKGPQWLVLMDLAFPGWHATVDGEPAEIYPANLVGRAVALSPGLHRIVFEYDPRAFRLGCRLALLAALAWGALALFGRSRRNGGSIKALLRRILPWIVTAGILWVLFGRTGFGEVKSAAAAADLPFLFGVTLLCTLPMYGLDVLSLSRVFAWFNRVTPFLDLARVKAASYLITLVNYNVGSGAIAYWQKRRHGSPFLESLASILFINVVDVIVLVVLIAAALPMLQPPMNRVIGGAIGMAAAVLAGHFLYWRGGFNFFILGGLRRWPIFKSFRLAKAGHYLRLAAIRLPFDLIFILNFWLALRAFDVKIPFLLALAYVPIILFVGVIPVTVAGLGTVQAVTLYLLRDYAPEATLLAFSLMMTVALTAVRVLLALPVFRGVSEELLSGGAKRDIPDAGGVSDVSGNAQREEHQENGNSS